MNARQKCKQLKKQINALYADYVMSAEATAKIVELVDAKFNRIEEQQVTCKVEKHFDGPVMVDENIANEMVARLEDLYDHFKQAVVFEGHTDPETGKYILEAKITVVMPELEEMEVMDEQ